MGSTNFLVWNSNANNQETDTQYLSDAQRVSGAPNGVAFPSPTGNKAFFQWSTFVAAFAQMMANKGYTMSDANFGNLVSALTNVQTLADLRGVLQVIAYSSLITCDVSEYQGFQISLSGNTTLTVNGVVAGDPVPFIFVQDSVGGHTVTWPSNFYGVPQPDLAPNAVTVILVEVAADDSGRAAAPAISQNGTFATTGLICPTRTTGDNTTNAATTAFVQAAIAAGFTNGNNSNGYWQKDPTGKIEQWSGDTILSISGGSPVTVDFPINFTSAPSISVQITELPVNGSYYQVSLDISIPVTTTGFTVGFVGAPSTIHISWRAVGY